MVGTARIARSLQYVSSMLIPFPFLTRNTYLVVKRRSINSIAAVWATDNNHVAVRREAILAINLFLAAVGSRRSGPDIDMALTEAIKVVGALLTVVLI